MDDGNGVSQVFTSDLNGANITQVTDTLEENYSALLSPDENWLLVDRESSPDELFPSDLFIIKLDGSQEIRITYDDYFYYECSWSPKNYWIVVGSISDSGTKQIILINIEGEMIQMDLEPGKYSYPTWRPAVSP
jgi:Tol biopolymer transport system component